MRSISRNVLGIYRFSTVDWSHVNCSKRLQGFDFDMGMRAITTMEIITFRVYAFCEGNYCPLIPKIKIRALLYKFRKLFKEISKMPLMSVCCESNCGPPISKSNIQALNVNVFNWLHSKLRSQLFDLRWLFPLFGVEY